MEVVKEDPHSSNEANSPFQQQQQHMDQRQPQHRGSVGRRESKIVAPSQRRVKNEGSIPPPTSPSPIQIGIYERSMLHLAAKEQQMKRTEEELKKACTFTPETNQSRSSSACSGSSCTILDRPISEHSPAKMAQPRNNNAIRQEGSRQEKPFGCKTTTTTPSRIDWLYHEGVRREQNRARTNRVDDEDRRRRAEEKELRNCTFQPNMDWRRKKPLESPTTASQDSACNESLRTTPPKRRDIPPVDMITTRRVVHDHVRREEEAQSFVEPHLDTTDMTSVGTESVGDDTEYGSI